VANASPPTIGQVLTATSPTNAIWQTQGAEAVNPQTGTTYKFVLTDAYKLITFDNVNPVAVTIDTNANVAFSIGTRIDCVQVGVGKVTFGGGGVTINSKNGNTSIGGQWSAVTLIKMATDTWLLLGDLIA